MTVLGYGSTRLSSCHGPAGYASRLPNSAIVARSAGHLSFGFGVIIFAQNGEHWAPESPNVHIRRHQISGLVAAAGWKRMGVSEISRQAASLPISLRQLFKYNQHGKHSNGSSTSIFMRISCYCNGLNQLMRIIVYYCCCCLNLLLWHCTRLISLAPTRIMSDRVIKRPK